MVGRCGNDVTSYHCVMYNSVYVPPNEAEKLLDIAKKHLLKKCLNNSKHVFICQKGVASLEFARLQLARKLAKNPPLAFRAIVENWDLNRIVREVNC